MFLNEDLNMLGKVRFLVGGRGGMGRGFGGEGP